MTSSVLVTGGAGYIGSHTTLSLLKSGRNVVVLDNLSTGSYESLERVAKIAGRKPVFVNGDIRDDVKLRAIFSEHQIDAVLHFAGLKSVGDSVKAPLNYYDNNVAGSLQLCSVMADAGIYRLVFSSSAVVYGDGEAMPVSEEAKSYSPPSPYGRTKLIVERLLQDLANSDKRWRIAVLRYFNPVGAHPSGLIGEDPNGMPSNLLPYISRVAFGQLPSVQVFGNDYPTPDGTGIRDYIHVVDLAEGHLSALDALGRGAGFGVWNLGTGRGYSVLEVIRAFENACGRSVPFEIRPRREGDIEKSWADAGKAFRELGWKAKLGLPEMMLDAWRWQVKNPNGYKLD